MFYAPEIKNAITVQSRPCFWRTLYIYSALSLKPRNARDALVSHEQGRLG